MTPGAVDALPSVGLRAARAGLDLRRHGGAGRDFLADDAAGEFAGNDIRGGVACRRSSLARTTFSWPSAPRRARSWAWSLVDLARKTWERRWSATPARWWVRTSTVGAVRRISAAARLSERRGPARRLGMTYDVLIRRSIWRRRARSRPQPGAAAGGRSTWPSRASRPEYRAVATPIWALAERPNVSQGVRLCTEASGQLTHDHA